MEAKALQHVKLLSRVYVTFTSSPSMNECAYTNLETIDGSSKQYMMILNTISPASQLDHGVRYHGIDGDIPVARLRTEGERNGEELVAKLNGMSKHHELHALHLDSRSYHSMISMPSFSVEQSVDAIYDSTEIFGVAVSVSGYPQ